MRATLRVHAARWASHLPRLPLELPLCPEVAVFFWGEERRTQRGLNEHLTTRNVALKIYFRKFRIRLAQRLSMPARQHTWWIILLVLHCVLSLKLWIGNNHWHCRFSLRYWSAISNSILTVLEDHLRHLNLVCSGDVSLLLVFANETQLEQSPLIFG